MKLPVQVRPCLVPSNFYHYWHDYGRCIACKQEVRHEMHLYNHYRKYHWDFRTVLHYFVWYDMLQQWVEISRNAYISYRRMHQRPTAIARQTY